MGCDGSLACGARLLFKSAAPGGSAARHLVVRACSCARCRSRARLCSCPLESAGDATATSLYGSGGRTRMCVTTMRNAAPPDCGDAFRTERRSDMKGLSLPSTRRRSHRPIRARRVAWPVAAARRSLRPARLAPARRQGSIVLFHQQREPRRATDRLTPLLFPRYCRFGLFTSALRPSAGLNVTVFLAAIVSICARRRQEHASVPPSVRPLRRRKRTCLEPMLYPSRSLRSFTLNVPTPGSRNVPVVTYSRKESAPRR